MFDAQSWFVARILECTILTNKIAVILKQHFTTESTDYRFDSEDEFYSLRRRVIYIIVMWFVTEMLQ